MYLDFESHSVLLLRLGIHGYAVVRLMILYEKECNENLYKQAILDFLNHHAHFIKLNEDQFLAQPHILLNNLDEFV